jgi:hypothetical protein
VGVGSVLVSVATVLFFLAKNSFEAGREAQRLAGTVVTREEAHQMVREAVEPVSRRADDAVTRCSAATNCCDSQGHLALWVDWDTTCLDAVRERVHVSCPNRPHLTFPPRIDFPRTEDTERSIK